MNNQERQPYEPLGRSLRRIREKMRESLAEVSGAVEIDEKVLTRIETGRERPSEDVLLLLISHFGIRDDKAAELWQLAGYDNAKEQNDEPLQAKQAVMIMVDPRIMYSDNIEVTAGDRGVVMNFAQAAGPNSQPLTIARVGMSREQAATVARALQQALQALDQPREPRQLPPGSGRQKNT